MSKLLISVVGPTAIGKTSLAIRLAQHFNAEIISSDSRQFFKEMSIGTAVPSDEELALAKHHFIQQISMQQPYSVGDFERDALKQIEILHKTNPVVIMVGGSGLYSNAVINGLDKFPEIDPQVRIVLNERLKTEGLEVLQQELQQLDPKAYDTIAIDNPKRVIRALEVSIGSGKPYSSFLNQTQNKRTFKTITIGLNADRQIIYDRINLRVDMMIDMGLLKEAEALVAYRDLNALNTVGYKELFKYFDGDWDLEFAISEIKKNTRRFAKRQLTWYRKDQSILWFDYQYDFNAIINSILKYKA